MKGILLILASIGGEKDRDKKLKTHKKLKKLYSHKRLIKTLKFLPTKQKGRRYETPSPIKGLVSISYLI